MPLTQVSVVIHSDPIELGLVVSSLTGSIDTVVTIPADLDPGDHTLLLQGIASDGTVQTVTQPVVVAADLVAAAFPAPVAQLPAVGRRMSFTG